MRVAHLTTVDMSLRFLVLPQLRSVVDLGGEAYGISAEGPFVDEIVAAGVRFVPLEGSTRGWSLGDDLRAARALWAILRRIRSRRAPHAQSKTGGVRADRRAARRRTARGQHRPRPVRHRGGPAQQAARGLPVGSHRLALLRRRVGPEPRGSRPAHQVAHLGPEEDRPSRQRSGSGAVQPGEVRLRGASPDQERDRCRSQTTSSLVSWGGWWQRRVTPSCSRQPRGLGDGYLVLAIGPDEPDKPDALPREMVAAAEATGRPFPRDARRRRSALRRYGHLRAPVAPRGLPPLGHGGGGDRAPRGGHRHQRVPPGGGRR